MFSGNCMRENRDQYFADLSSNDDELVCNADKVNNNSKN
jgi:hypothetical protein